MNTRHLVDPELLPHLDDFAPPRSFRELVSQLKTGDASVLAKVSIMRERLPGIRASDNEASDPMAADASAYPDIEVTTRRIPGPDGAPDIRIVIYRPKAAPEPLPALLWLHGGGYILGRAYETDPFLHRIAHTIRCAAISVDYRPAPETQHPGPVEDCFAALSWLRENSATLGVDSNRLAIGGDSAGGGLAANLALLTRDRGAVLPDFQLLIYPMLDDRTVTATDLNPYVGEFVWTREYNALGWAALLGQEPGGTDVPPYAAAARAQDLAGLPPTFIGVGTLDLFLDEDIEYARRLLRSGVPTELRVYPRATHGFMNAPTTSGRMLMRDCMDALGRALHS
jgi:acetyl esterase/lipase